MKRFVAGALSLVCVIASTPRTHAQAAAPAAAPAVAPAAVPAADPAAAPAAAPAAEGRAKLDQVLEAYVAAFNSHDPAAVVALWTSDGIYVDKETGKRTEGREALAAEFKSLFAGSPQISLTGYLEGVRRVGTTAVMVDGVSTTANPGEDPDVAAFSAILVKEGDKWLLDSVHEMPLPVPESPKQALEPLAWMVGHWQDAGDGGAVDTTVRWSPSDAFLIRAYHVNREREEPYEGTQIIGWDPRAKQIRSWTFNSDGSFGDGSWSKNQDEWLVRSSQTLADGRAVTATQVIKMVDADTASVQTIAKDVEGNPEPASDPVLMKRVAEEPAAAAVTTPATGAAPVAAPAGAAPAATRRTR